MTNTSPADALIIGGGLVGLSIALALGRVGLRVAVIDRDRPADLAADRFEIGRAHV